MRDIAAEPPRATWVPALLRVGTGIVLLAAVGLAGVYGLRRYRAAQAASAAPQYYLVAADNGPVSATVSGAGAVQAVDSQSVTPAVGGQVQKILASVGQRVAVGDPLLQLADTQGLAAKVVADQAALLQAKQQLQQLTDPTAGQDPRSVTAAQLAVQQSQLGLTQAEQALSRAQASAASAAAVSTPVGGTVQAVDVLAGQSVGAGQPIASVQPAGAPGVVVAIPQADLPYLPVGAAVEVSVPSLARTFSGTVTAVGDTPSGGSAASGTAAAGGAPLYPLTVTLPDLPASTPAGASATVVFTPQNNPPATYTWSDVGQISYPAAVTVSAQQSGTVGSLPAVGAAVTAGQSLTTVTNPDTQSTLRQDALAVQQAQLSLQQAQLSLQLLQNPTPATAAQIASAATAVQTDTEALQQAQQDVADLLVRSPAAGTITAVDVTPGQNIGSGTTVAQVQSSAGVDVVAPIDELSIASVRVGQAVQVQIDAFPNQVFAGTVAAISPTAQTANGVSVYPVTVDLKSTQGLLAGMSAGVSIEVGSVQNALRVPAQSVTSLGAAGRGVVQVLQNGKPVPVAVQTGLVGVDYTQILSGLTAGEEVVAGQVSTTTNFGALFRGAGGPPGGRPGGGARAGG